MMITQDTGTAAGTIRRLQAIADAYDNKAARLLALGTPAALAERRHHDGARPYTKARIEALQRVEECNA